MKMEATYCSEISVNLQWTTWRNIPEKKTGGDSQGAWCEDELIGGKSPLVK
jgi:hypothetical protein